MRALTTATVAVLVAGVIAVFTVSGDAGPLDRADAERCGLSIADDLGMDPTAVTATEVGDLDLLRVSVATPAGVLVIDVRPADGRVLEVEMVLPGGSQRLDRQSRLRVFERGC